MNFEGISIVTGALGQDGFILCQRLRQLGSQVVAVARPGNAQIRRQKFLVSLGCRIIEQDIGDAVTTAALVAAVHPKYIFHLAAAHHASDTRPETPEVWHAMLSVNLAATEALARATVQAGLDCSLIYASSSQIWTARESEHHVDETTPEAPTTFYGRTKVWATDMLHQYRTHHGLRASIAILFNHESPWRLPNFVSRKIAMAAANAACGGDGTLRLINIGSRVDWQAATDVVEAFLLMARSGTPDDYVLASGCAHSVRDFVDAAYKNVGLNWSDFVSAELDQPCPTLIGVPNKAMQRLGWRPKQTFTDLVRSMVDADVARLRGEMLL